MKQIQLNFNEIDYLIKYLYKFIENIESEERPEHINTDVLKIKILDYLALLPPPPDIPPGGFVLSLSDDEEFEYGAMLLSMVLTLGDIITANGDYDTTKRVLVKLADKFRRRDG